jgi:hypothetical protein
MEWLTTRSKTGWNISRWHVHNPLYAPVHRLDKDFTSAGSCMQSHTARKSGHFRAGVTS